MELGGYQIDIFVDNFIQPLWQIKAPFLRLWHDILRETSIAYLPPPLSDLEKRSSVEIEGVHWLTLDDKILALLLLLFHAPYRKQLNELAIKPPFLAEIFLRFPSLA